MIVTDQNSKNYSHVVGGGHVAAVDATGDGSDQNSFYTSFRTHKNIRWFPQGLGTLRVDIQELPSFYQML